MIAEAHVMINSMIGYEDEVLKEVRKKVGVTSAYRVYGTYDIVARVEADCPENLRERVTGANGIRRIPNIRSTLTLFSYRGFTRNEAGEPLDVNFASL